MPKMPPRKGAKGKAIRKKKTRKDSLQQDEEEQDFLVDEVLEEGQQEVQRKLEKVETVAEVKKRIADQVIGRYGGATKPTANDDFFMPDAEEESKRITQEQDEEAEKLKQEWLRKNNRLFEAIDHEYASEGFSEPIQYKGHKLCITAFELNDTHIFSCSKDRSIIRWDRETKQKQFLSWGKEEGHHRNDILCLGVHHHYNLVATAGEDCQIRLWDPRAPSLVDTLRGHKHHINGLKFGANSSNLCSVSSDLTLKVWDVGQRGLIETFHEHTREVLDVDCFNANDFLTSGSDHQVIAWKTEKETKVIFKGHDYPIDRVRTINSERFVTACQDGSINLWHTRKIKPVFKLPAAHPKGWISAMDNLNQTNILATAGIDRTVKLWGIEGESKGLNLLKEIEVNGIVTDLKLRQDLLAVTECDQLRLGRWITDKCRNKIKIFNLNKA